jgi:hypothetical protein
MEFLIYLVRNRKNCTIKVRKFLIQDTSKNFLCVTMNGLTKSKITQYYVQYYHINIIITLE